MYNDILSVLACLFNLFGTIFAVLSIVKMSFKDVMWTRTYDYFNNSEKAVFEQRYNARVGISIIFIGAILQVICIFYKNISFLWFIILAGIANMIAVTIWLLEKHRMKKDKIKAGVR